MTLISNLIQQCWKFTWRWSETTWMCQKENCNLHAGWNCAWVRVPPVEKHSVDDWPHLYLRTNKIFLQLWEKMRGGALYVRFATLLLHCTLTEEAFFDALAREVGTLLGGGEYPSFLVWLKMIINGDGDWELFAQHPLKLLLIAIFCRKRRRRSARSKSWESIFSHLIKHSSCGEFLTKKMGCIDFLDFWGLYIQIVQDAVKSFLNSFGFLPSEEDPLPGSLREQGLQFWVCCARTFPQVSERNCVPLIHRTIPRNIIIIL